CGVGSATRPSNSWPAASRSSPSPCGSGSSTRSGAARSPCPSSSRRRARARPTSPSTSTSCIGTEWWAAARRASTSTTGSPTRPSSSCASWCAAVSRRSWRRTARPWRAGRRAHERARSAAHPGDLARRALHQRGDLRGAAPALGQVLVALEAGQRVEERDDIVLPLLRGHGVPFADAPHDRVQRLPPPAVPLARLVASPLHPRPRPHAPHAGRVRRPEAAEDVNELLERVERVGLLEDVLQAV